MSHIIASSLSSRPLRDTLQRLRTGADAGMPTILHSFARSMRRGLEHYLMKDADIVVSHGQDLWLYSSARLRSVSACSHIAC